MKKGLTALTSVVLAMLMSFSFLLGGCFGIGEGEDNSPKEYTIQYTDDAGTHQLSVTAGMPYSIESIPVKYGYEFLGLFDAEVGGTQYVSANGASLSPYTDGKNIVLFPQFKAKEYTVILDYQGATVTGSRQLTVAYGSTLPELPKNLTLENKVFNGWYTAVNCKGTQVADEYGLIPVVSVLNDTNFDLSGEYVYLYAGFETEKFTVTFCFESGMNTEDVQVEYNTPISEVVPKTRVNGNAVLTWSKTQGGEVWNGKVTGDMVLYAVEYAPVIELDSNGGDAVTPVVARAGATISLPTPTKDLAKFLYWEDMSGNEFTATTMPSASISLKAVWQAKIVFDENGGSDVTDISVAVGNTITLPTPEKEGFIFAGWYTAEKEQYSSTKMPTAGIALKAGWYKEKTEVVTWISSSSSVEGRLTSASTSELCFGFDFSKRFTENKPVYINITWHMNLKTEDSSSQVCYAEIYSQKKISSAYLLQKHSFNNVTNSYKTFTFDSTLLVEDDFYICFYMTRVYYNWSYFDMQISDFYADIAYPDTTYLYLY